VIANTPISRRITREARLSCLINTALSGVFFVAVFGVTQRPIAMAAPDRFALDFAAQAAAIALMATLVPGLVVRAALARQEGLSGQPAVTVSAVLRIAVLAVVAGLASAAVLAMIALFGPWASIGWIAALALKLAYGAGLGFAVTSLALRRLFAHKDAFAKTGTAP